MRAMRPATDPPQPSVPLTLAPRLRRRAAGPGALRRALKHPRAMPYQRLIALVLSPTRLAPLRGAGGLADFAALTLVNLAGAVLIRRQQVLNVLFGLAGRSSRTLAAVAPLERLEGQPRRRDPRGCALAGTAWLCAFTVTALTRPATTTTRVVASAIAAALPDRRRRRAARRPPPRPQRLRAHAPLRRLERGRAVLGPDPAPRAARRRARRARRSRRAGRSGCSRSSR